MFTETRYGSTAVVESELGGDVMCNVGNVKSCRFLVIQYLCTQLLWVYTTALGVHNSFGCKRCRKLR